MIFEKLTLFTSELEKTRDFYTKALELELVNEENNEFTLKLGSTYLSFRTTDKGCDPFYHFAINIPENKMEEAKEWTKSRVDLNKEEGEDEVLFKSWNARSIYFEDPSGNIVEFIARHNLSNGIDREFTSKDLLNVSEVGIVTEEVIPMVRKLNELGIPNWRDDSEGLTPIGDEEGLFIVVKNERRWYFSNKNARPYPLIVQVENLGEFAFTEGENFELK